MLQGEHSAILLTFIKLPFVIKTLVLSIFEWPFYTCFTLVLNVFYTGLHARVLPYSSQPSRPQQDDSEIRLEDLNVLRRSPDLLYNVKISQGQLQLIMEQILFYHIWGLQTFWSSDLNNLMNLPIKQPSDF